MFEKTLNFCTPIISYGGGEVERKKQMSKCGVGVSLKGALKVVCNEMNGGSDTGRFSSFWYGTHVIGIGFNFNGDVVF